MESGIFLRKTTTKVVDKTRPCSGWPCASYYWVISKFHHDEKLDSFKWTNSQVPFQFSDISWTGSCHEKMRRRTPSLSRRRLIQELELTGTYHSCHQIGGFHDKIFVHLISLWAYWVICLAFLHWTSKTRKKQGKNNVTPLVDLHCNHSSFLDHIDIFLSFFYIGFVK